MDESTKRLKQILDGKLEQREATAVSLYENLSLEEMEALLLVCKQTVINGYTLNTPISKLMGEMLFMGLAKVAVLAIERKQFREEFGD